MSRYKQISNYKNYIAYKEIEAKSKRVLKIKSRESWRCYVNKLNKGTSSANIWKMIKCISNRERPPALPTLSDNLLEDVMNRLAPASVQNNFDNAISSSDCDGESVLDSSFTIRELKNSLKVSKSTAPGKDQFTYNMIRNTPINFLLSLLEILNCWWTRGDTFDRLREVVICLILKPGKDSNLASSYRPISLMSCFTKTFERMIKVRLEWYLESNSLLPPNQFGFRRGMGTLDALTSLVTNIQLAFSKKQFIGLLFADIEGAYDAVDLNILARKLFKINCSRNVIRGILQLFSNRKIYVRDHKGDLHGPRVLTQGLMQGSVLSPILFNVYTASLHNLWEDNTCIQYADDICVFAVKNTEHECVSELERIVDKLGVWMRDHGFELAPQKCAVMICSRARNTQHRAEASIGLNNNTFPLVRSFRYLGLILDDKLRWTEHISYVKRRCEKACNILKCTTRHYWGADVHVSLLFYKAYIRSIVDYGSFLYGNAARTNLLQLDRIQFKCLRIVLGAMRSTPCPTLLAESGEMPLSHRRTYLASKFITKLSIFNISGIIVNICNLTSFTLTNSYWSKKKEPLVCHAFLSLNRFQDHIVTQKKLPFFCEPLELISYSPRIVYPQYTLYGKINNAILKNAINQFPESIPFYTDGSKSESGVGSAVYCPIYDLHIRCKLLHLCTIFTAEAFAIWKALDWALHKSIGSILIITDSKSVLEALSSHIYKNFKNKIIVEILKICHLLELSGCSVYFVWTKGHSGITGNEKVDSLAKEAVLNGDVEHILTIFDLNLYFLRATVEVWKNDWSQFVGQSNNQYVQLHRELPRNIVYHQRSRHFSTTIFRLKVQHGRYQAHLFRIGVVEEATCPFCNNVEGSLNHILFECTQTMRASDKLLETLRACGVSTPTYLTNILAGANMDIYKALVEFFNEVEITL